MTAIYRCPWMTCIYYLLVVFILGTLDLPSDFLLLADQVLDDLRYFSISVVWSHSSGALWERSIDVFFERLDLLAYFSLVINEMDTRMMSFLFDFLMISNNTRFPLTAISSTSGLFRRQGIAGIDETVPVPLFLVLKPFQFIWLSYWSSRRFLLFIFPTTTVCFASGIRASRSWSVGPSSGLL